MTKSSKERGTDAEKYARAFMENLGYLVEIHPRTSTYTGYAWISRDNDFFGEFDLNCERAQDGAYVQVKSTAGGWQVDRGAISSAMRSIDQNYPIHNPCKHVLVFWVWKEWVGRTPDKKRHKEYFHRAWRRELTASGFVWPERVEWSHLPPQKRLHSNSPASSSSTSSVADSTASML